MPATWTKLEFDGPCFTLTQDFVELMASIEVYVDSNVIYQQFDYNNGTGRKEIAPVIAGGLDFAKRLSVYAEDVNPVG